MRNEWRDREGESSRRQGGNHHNGSRGIDAGSNHGQSNHSHAGGSEYFGSEYPESSNQDTGGMHGGQAGRQGDHAHEADYKHWREEQMKKLDEEYSTWRSERRKKFGDDFDKWRSERTSSSDAKK